MSMMMDGAGGSQRGCPGPPREQPGGRPLKCGMRMLAAALILLPACGGADAEAPGGGVDPPIGSESAGSPAPDGGSAPLTGPALLFSGTGISLPPSDQEAIFAALGLDHDPSNPTVLLDPHCGMPVEVGVEANDLDGDGAQEIFVELGSVCLYGGTGVGTTLFVRDPGGVHRPHLGFPGMVVEQLAERRSGFPDLLIGGMSDCFAVWGWDGSAYVHIRNEPQTPGGCMGIGPP